MYVYSLACLVVTALLARHINTNSPFHCLSLAWLYVLDSLVNALYTAAFAATWFLLMLGKSSGPGADTVKDTAGFTDPVHNVSAVEVVATPNNDAIVPGQDAVVAATPASTANGTTTLLDTQSMNAIGVIVILWTVRAYFCLVMLSWARSVVRQHIAIVSVRSGQYSNSSKGLAEDPFAEGKGEGQGWKGKLGRFMIALGPRYFLGPENEGEDESWVQTVGRKFGVKKHVAGHEVDSVAGNGIALQKVSDTRPTERERRRRSGTGPPLPEVQAQAAAIQANSAKEDENGLLKVPNP